MIAVALAFSLPLAGANATAPKIALSPSHGATGSSVAVSGQDFPRKTEVRLAWDGSAEGMPTATVTSHGTFKASIRVPVGASGRTHCPWSNSPSYGARRPPDFPRMETRTDPVGLDHVRGDGGSRTDGPGPDSGSDHGRHPSAYRSGNRDEGTGRRADTPRCADTHAAPTPKPTAAPTPKARPLHDAEADRRADAEADHCTDAEADRRADAEADDVRADRRHDRRRDA